MPSDVFSAASLEIIKAANLPISEGAIELIMAEEDTSEQYYINHYQHPEWPGGASGVTIAIGYDCGYADAAKIHRDFDGKIPAQMVYSLVSVCGIKSSDAHWAMLGIRNSVRIPWDVALKVFLDNDMPEWINTVETLMPRARELHPDCLGALVSLAYNRGASFNSSGPRDYEMRMIRDHIAAGDFDLVPKEFRSMKRLWPGVADLRNRREHEAVLFERGLSLMATKVSA